MKVLDSPVITNNCMLEASDEPTPSGQKEKASAEAEAKPKRKMLMEFYDSQLPDEQQRDHDQLWVANPDAAAEETELFLETY